MYTHVHPYKYTEVPYYLAQRQLMTKNCFEAVAERVKTTL